MQEECFTPGGDPEAVGSAGEVNAGRKREIQKSICEGRRKGKLFQAACRVHTGKEVTSPRQVHA